VIVFDVDSRHREIVRQGANGLLVSRRNARRPSVTIKSLIDDPVAPHWLARAAICDVAALYGSREVVTRYERLFRSVLDAC